MMRTCLQFFIVALSGVLSSALLVQAPEKKSEHPEKKSEHPEKKSEHPSVVRRPALKPQLRPVLDDDAVPAPAQEAPVKGCIACFGAPFIYGKYRSVSGDVKDNSYYLFKNPNHRPDHEPLPIVIRFHPGGFVSGEPEIKENDEINAYLSKGFAVASVGCRLVTKKYVYESKEVSKGVFELENRTEELIHVAKDGKMSLDSTGQTMEDYQVRVGGQEHMTKFLYDATQMIEHLIDNADDFGIDVNRIVFAGESLGGAAIQYLTWVYHKWNVGRYTPRGMIMLNAQLNYPVSNMLGETWDLFVETMGPKVKLTDVVSPEACPTVIGNDMCNAAEAKEGEESASNVSDYVLCNEEWNEKAMLQFCGDALQTRTLDQARSTQVWPREDKKVGRGMEKLWYGSENMQHHKPSESFYIYVANSKNGTGAEDVSEHSIFALNFAKFAEMGEHGGHQYTVYYTDFAHMSEEDRGMQRLEVSRPPGGLDLADPLPPAFNAPAAPVSLRAGRPNIASMPGPAPAPAPAPEEEVDSTVFNYLSTHGWREDLGVGDVAAGSLEERVLYACLAAGVGPFKQLVTESNETDAARPESGALRTALPSLGIAVASLLALLSGAP